MRLPSTSRRACTGHPSNLQACRARFTCKAQRTPDTHTLLSTSDMLLSTSDMFLSTSPCHSLPQTCYSLPHTCSSLPHHVTLYLTHVTLYLTCEAQCTPAPQQTIRGATQRYMFGCMYKRLPLNVIYQMLRPPAVREHTPIHLHTLRVSNRK